MFQKEILAKTAPETMIEPVAWQKKRNVPFLMGLKSLVANTYAMRRGQFV